MKPSNGLSWMQQLRDFERRRRKQAALLTDSGGGELQEAFCICYELFQDNKVLCVGLDRRQRPVLTRRSLSVDPLISLSPDLGQKLSVMTAPVDRAACAMHVAVSGSQTRTPACKLTASHQVLMQRQWSVSSVRPQLHSF